MTSIVEGTTVRTTKIAASWRDDSSRTAATRPGQRVAAHVLHDDVRPPVGIARVVDTHDVGVRQPAGEPRFAHESLQERFVPCEMLREQLDRDWPVELDVMCEIDRRHAASSELVLDAVATACERETQPLPFFP